MSNGYFNRDAISPGSVQDLLGNIADPYPTSGLLAVGAVAGALTAVAALIWDRTMMVGRVIVYGKA